MAAEVVYRKAQMIDPDANKACNLGMCLIKQAPPLLSNIVSLHLEDEFIHGLEDLESKWGPLKPRRLPIFEEISNFKDQLAC